MKKMPYAILFILVLAVLVFAGCKSFSSGGESTTQPEGSESAAAAQTTAQPVTDEPAGEPQTGEAQTEGTETTAPAVTDPAEVTDEKGETVYTPEEISSIREEMKTTQPAETTVSAEPTTTAAVPVDSEYDTLRSGNFYLTASISSDGQTSPMVLALNDSLVYMQTSSDGLTMGFLIMDGKTYLLNPGDKTYCKLNSTVASIMQEAGMMSEDEIRSMINEFGFGSMKDLDQADAAVSGTYGTRDCTIYTFNNENDAGKKRVYMDGATLLAIETISAEGQLVSGIYINKITNQIPTFPPEDYSSKGLLSFISDISSLMDS